jgi:hypothetical protein
MRADIQSKKIKALPDRAFPKLFRREWITESEALKLGPA